MAASKKKRPAVRSFERAARIHDLLDTGIINSADEIPADAIPARPEFVKRSLASIHTRSRPPYFQAREIICTDCKQPFVWVAEEQRFWYEQARDSIYSEAVRCAVCRKRRKGALINRASSAGDKD